MFGTINTLINYTYKLIPKKAIVAVSIIAFFISCESYQGPCDYTESKIMATIISIENTGKQINGKNEVRVLVELNGSSLSEKPQLLNELIYDDNRPINEDFVAKNNVLVGNKYKAVVSELRSGKCTPLYFTFEVGFRD
jgi:hypothetical protein